MVGLSIFILLLSTTIWLLYKYSTRNFDYWKKRNVPHVKPIPFVGNFLDVFTMKENIGPFFLKFYQKFQTPYFGMYVFNRPGLVLKSPELIKTILVKDFGNFQNRSTVCDDECDSVTSKMLFLAKGTDWKNTRNKVTPVFTAGKIKSMFKLIAFAAEDLVTYISKHLSENSLECKEVCAKYSTDVIASCAFGINAHSFECENADFRVVGRKMFDLNFFTAFRQISYFIAPQLVKFFKISFFDPSILDFMRNVIWTTIGEREKTNSKRNDIIDTIIKIKNREQADGIKFEGDMVVAQAGQFYAAGFETVSSTMSFTLYELCLQNKIQNRLREDIKTNIARHGGCTYEAINEMKYLRMVIDETLRKYPVLPFLDREAVVDYKIPGSDFLIGKGTAVYIPMYALHYDPQYFPDPERYDPERFSDENKTKIPNGIYVPFGEGPRNCIGERFGLIVTKIGLINILNNFEVIPTQETPVPIKYDPRTFLLTSSVGLPMKFKKIVSDAA